LPESKSARILDFGCGDGRVVGFLNEKGYSLLEATDIDSQLVDHVNAEFKVEAYPLSQFNERKRQLANQFDMIIAKDVIYYLELKDLNELLLTFKRLLKPGGTLLVEIFNGSIFTGPFVMHKDLGILHTFTEHSLEQVLLDANYNIISLQGNKFPTRGIKSMVFNMLQFVWRSVLQFIYFLERGIDSQNPKILNRKIIVVAKA